MVSIIVPVYNAQATLRRCIDSILSQNNGDFELLLIDDGSTDNSPEICDLYTRQDSRVIVFHKKNSGVSSARNFGLEKCKGQWITFVDSDDYLEQNYIPDTFDLKYDWIVQNCKHIDEIGCVSILEYIEPQEFVGISIKRFCANYLHYDVFRSPWAKFFKKSIIDEKHLTFNENMSLAEDTIFCMRYFISVSAVKILANSNYVYFTYRDNRNWCLKYNMSVRRGLYHMRQFFKYYSLLPSENTRLLSMVLECFNRVVLNGNITNRYAKQLKWELSPTIMKIKRRLGQDYGVFLIIHRLMAYIK